MQCLQAAGVIFKKGEKMRKDQAKEKLNNLKEKISLNDYQIKELKELIDEIYDYFDEQVQVLHATIEQCLEERDDWKRRAYETT